MEPQISNTMQLNSIIVAQKNNLQTLTEKIDRMNKEHERINVYKETIRKQEKVIAKLESVMKDGMEEVRQARRAKLELEELKKKEGNGGLSRAVSRGQERQEI
jgi:altronate dehydratase